MLWNSRPGAAEVDGDVNEFDGAVGGDLADYGNRGDQSPGLDQEPVSGSAGDLFGQIVPAGGELIDDRDEFVGLERILAR